MWNVNVVIVNVSLLLSSFLAMFEPICLFHPSMSKNNTLSLSIVLLLFLMFYWVVNMSHSNTISTYVWLSMLFFVLNKAHKYDFIVIENCCSYSLKRLNNFNHYLSSVVWIPWRIIQKSMIFLRTNFRDRYNLLDFFYFQ